MLGVKLPPYLYKGEKEGKDSQSEKAEKIDPENMSMTAVGREE